MDRIKKVLHVEVGGSYGGSLRALEVYLRASNPERLEHHALFYYPVPGAERLTPYVRTAETIYDSAPAWLKRATGQMPGSGRQASRWTDVLPAGLRTLAGLGRQLPPVRHLIPRLRRGRYDVVHSNNTFTYQAPTLIAARLVRVPLVTHVRNPVEPGLLSRRLMRLANAVVTVSHTLEKELRGWGLPVMIRVCHDGLELPTANLATAHGLRASLIGSGNVLIGSVGRLDNQKGYSDLIRAARRVVDARPGVRFAIAGDGPLRRDLERLIHELRLQEHFRLCGFRSDVGSFVAALDLFVSSSHWEGLPLVVLDALLLGKPVIATGVGGTPEIVIPGRTGQLVPARNPQALASAMISFLESPGRAAAPAEEARSFAAAWCDPVTSARQLDQLIANVSQSRY